MMTRSGRAAAGIAVLIGAVTAGEGAIAQVRQSSTAMTCRQAAGFVAGRGAVVLGTGGYTYDRFVVDRRYCQATEETRAAFVPTRDNPACLVGYTCFEPSNRFFDDF